MDRRAQARAPLATALAVLVVIAAAGEGSARAEAGDPCVGVTCSGHGICVPFEGAPACNCDEGFVPDPAGTGCAPEGGTLPPPPPAEPPQTEGQGAQPPPSGWGEPLVEAPEPPPAVEPPPVEPLAEPPAVEPPPPEPPAAPATVPVTIGLRRGNRLLAVEAGGQRFECRTPCTLDVPAGEVRIGPPAGRWRRELAVQVDGPSQVTVARERSGVRTAGLALAVGGGALTALGIAVAVAASPMISSNPGLPTNGEDPAGANAAGLAIAIPGMLGFATGLVLLAVSPEAYTALVGPASAPGPAAEEGEPRASAPRPRLRGLGLAPIDGGAAATALVTF